MGHELLVTERVDAGADFICDFDDHIPVSVACWIVAANSDHAVLYIASDHIHDGNISSAYGEVLQRLNGKGRQWLDPFQIKLLNTSDPIAQAAIEVRDHFGAKMPLEYDGSSLGRTSIDGACIYPPAATMKAAH